MASKDDLLKTQALRCRLTDADAKLAALKNKPGWSDMAALYVAAIREEVDALDGDLSVSDKVALTGLVCSHHWPDPGQVIGILAGSDAHHATSFRSRVPMQDYENLFRFFTEQQWNALQREGASLKSKMNVIFRHAALLGCRAPNEHTKRAWLALLQSCSDYSFDGICVREMLAKDWKAFVRQQRKADKYLECLPMPHECENEDFYREAFLALGGAKPIAPRITEQQLLAGTLGVKCRGRDVTHSQELALAARTNGHGNGSGSGNDMIKMVGNMFQMMMSQMQSQMQQSQQMRQKQQRAHDEDEDVDVNVLPAKKKHRGDEIAITLCGKGKKDGGAGPEVSDPLPIKDKDAANKEEEANTGDADEGDIGASALMHGIAARDAARAEAAAARRLAKAAEDAARAEAAATAAATHAATASEKKKAVKGTAKAVPKAAGSTKTKAKATDGKAKGTGCSKCRYSLRGCAACRR